MEALRCEVKFPMTRILCAAIWVDDGVERVHQPTKTGLVYCGYRHGSIFEQISDRTSPKVSGFLTSDGRFVDRKEALSIAKIAGQVIGDEHPTSLFSENLY